MIVNPEGLSATYSSQSPTMQGMFALTCPFLILAPDRPWQKLYETNQGPQI